MSTTSRTALIRAVRNCNKLLHQQAYSSTSSPPSTPQTSSPFASRHLLSVADLSTQELKTLVRNAHSQKQSIRSGSIPSSLLGALAGKTVAMTFSKRITRMRVLAESAVATMGGSGLFLSKEHIQLGVNESLKYTSIELSSIVSAIVARVGAHSDVAGLAAHSTVPVINALSDKFHPMQALPISSPSTRLSHHQGGPETAARARHYRWDWTG